ncbi:MAG: hypothetical protein M3137_00635 [Actinomycetota bacterium]|nr:hypothetical protein [Actinomycetota bacterium]
MSASPRRITGRTLWLPLAMVAAIVGVTLTGCAQAVLVANAVRARHLTVPLDVAANVSAGGGYQQYPATYRHVLAQRTADRLALAANLSGATITAASARATTTAISATSPDTA